jgi:hypothetical protein
MTTNISPPLSVWRLDPGLGAAGAGALRGVLAISPEELWAVGDLVPEGGHHSGALVVRWTPDAEFIGPAPVDPLLDVRLHAVDWAADFVWAIGEIADEAGERRPRIERYSRLSGAAAVVEGPVADGDSALHGVAMLSACEGWAVGGIGPGCGADYTHTLVARWNGGTWETVPSPSPGTLTNRLHAVAARATDDVWAVGCSSVLPGRTDGLIMHWDGTFWTTLPTPPQATDSQLVSVAAVSPTSVWATGATTRGDGESTGLILHWNGLNWRSVPTPSFVTHTSGVAVLAENDIWFSGYSTLDGPEAAHVAHWDGSQLRVEFASLATSGDVRIQGNVGSALNGICAVGDRGVAVGWHEPDLAKRPAAFYRSTPETTC